MRGSSWARLSAGDANVRSGSYVDVDQVDAPLGRRFIARDDGRDRIADEADLVAAERVFVVADRQDAVGDRELVAGEDEMHAVQRRCARDVSTRTMRACGCGRPQQPAVEHARQDDVVGEARLAGDLGARVDAAARPSDDASSARLIVRLSGICADQPLRRRLDGFDDLQVAGAAAQVARQRLADPLARRMRLASSSALAVIRMPGVQ